MTRRRDRQRRADADRLVQRRLSGVPAHYLGQTAITAALGAGAKVEPGEVSEVILGQILTAGQGQNPARQASINAGMPERCRPTASTSLRLGPAGGGAGLPGDPERRRQHRRRRRPGEHEPGAARRLSAQRHQDGRARVRRHDAQGRAVGRLPRLPHGHTRPRTSPRSGRSPARSRTSSRSPRRTRPRPRRRPAGSRTRSRR